MMRNHRKKIIAAAAIAAVLAAAFALGGNYNDPAGISPAPLEPVVSSGEAIVLDGVDGDPLDSQESVAGDVSRIENPAPESNPSPGTSGEATDGDAKIGNEAFTVTLSVRCETLLDNMGLLNEEKHGLVPADGVIFSAAAVTAYEGESVFNVLQREMRAAKIHMEFRNTPIYNSAYIKGINNLYEFDAGELSGWMYKVNGWFPNYGCSRYQLLPGDVVEWHYSCDLGRDLGESFLEGGQTDE